MKKFLSPHQAYGVEWQGEIWRFDRPVEDYQARLRCRHCGSMTPLIQCPLISFCGCGSESCGDPVYKVLCPKCSNVLGFIDDERGFDKDSLFNLQPDGEFINPPDS